MKSLKYHFIVLLLFLSTQSLYAEVSVQSIAGHSDSKQVVVPATSGTGWRLTSEQWEFSRNGEALLSLPVLKQIINAWLSEKDKLIEIQYPGGEDGEFWVQELSDWFVALGIPSDAMVVVPGSGADDMIQFNLVSDTGSHKYEKERYR
jgi:hypothetical protein